MGGVSGILVSLDRHDEAGNEAYLTQFGCRELMCEMLVSAPSVRVTSAARSVIEKSSTTTKTAPTARFLAVYTMKPEDLTSFRSLPKAEQDAIDAVG